MAVRRLRRSTRARRGQSAVLGVTPLDIDDIVRAPAPKRRRLLFTSPPVPAKLPSMPHGVPARAGVHHPPSVLAAEGIGAPLRSTSQSSGCGSGSGGGQARMGACSASGRPVGVHGMVRTVLAAGGGVAASTAAVRVPPPLHSAECGAGGRFVRKPEDKASPSPFPAGPASLWSGSSASSSLSPSNWPQRSHPRCAKRPRDQDNDGGATGGTDGHATASTGSPSEPDCVVRHNLRLRGVSRKCVEVLVAHLRTRLRGVGPPRSRYPRLPPGDVVFIVVFLLVNPKQAASVAQLAEAFAISPRRIVAVFMENVGHVAHGVQFTAVRWPSKSTRMTMRRHTDVEGWLGCLDTSKLRVRVPYEILSLLRGSEWSQETRGNDVAGVRHTVVLVEDTTNRVVAVEVERDEACDDASDDQREDASRRQHLSMLKRMTRASEPGRRVVCTNDHPADGLNLLPSEFLLADCASGTAAVFPGVSPSHSHLRQRPPDRFVDRDTESYVIAPDRRSLLGFAGASLSQMYFQARCRKDELLLCRSAHTVSYAGPSGEEATACVQMSPCWGTAALRCMFPALQRYSFPSHTLEHALRLCCGIYNLQQT